MNITKKTKENIFYSFAISGIWFVSTFFINYMITLFTRLSFNETILFASLITVIVSILSFFEKEEFYDKISQTYINIGSHFNINKVNVAFFISGLLTTLIFI